MKAQSLWAIKTMTGIHLATTASHSLAIREIDRHQAEHSRFPLWCGELRIICIRRPANPRDGSFSQRRA